MARPETAATARGEGLAAWAHLGVTAARYLGARLGARGLDPASLLALRPGAPDAGFTVIGPGASLNDLGPDDRAAIAAGTAAAVNMAALAPFDFDIISLEALKDARDHEALRAAILAKSRRPLLWFQDRRKHDSPWLRELDREFGLYRYRRASVSIRGDMRNFTLAFHRFMAPRIFDRPDLRVSFALTGSVARVTLLGLALGYRNIRFAGVDLGTTPYFWLENPADRTDGDSPALSDMYRTASVGAGRQGGAEVVPNVFQLLETLQAHDPSIRFSTFDPARRSRLTPFLDGLRGAAG